jgi:hypothetical protein
LWGKNFEENHQKVLILLRRWSTSEQSIAHTQSIARFDFAAKMHTQNKEKYSFSFFSQIYLFKTFYRHFSPQNVHYLGANSYAFHTKYFKLFLHLLEFFYHSPAQDLSNNKKRSFLRLLWAEIFLRQFTKF